MTSSHLRFAPDILKRLGEELIPNIDQGIVELARNAYDADARRCTVDLVGATEAGGSIVIEDDGVGMLRSDIVNGWLVLGRSEKASHRRTSRRRIPVGEKGLGRLAALRMGHRAELRTRPAGKPGVEYVVVFDWARFDRAAVVEDVEITISEHRTQQAPGTTVTVENLRFTLTKADVSRLARALVLLTDPFSHKTGFRAELIAPTFRDLERRVRIGYFDEADYKLIAAVDAKGGGRAEVTDRAGRVLFHARDEELWGTGGAYRCPAARFELWTFLLKSDRFQPRAISTKEVREWLDVVGGVHLYHRGLRVHPYGDPGHDWLEMNLLRSRAPEERPSTNNSVGRMVVRDPHHELLQKTDRSGFVETEGFAELRRFGQDALRWMGKERTKLAEDRRQREKRKAPTAMAEARATLRERAEALPPSVRPEIMDAVRQLETESKRFEAVLQDELRLYRTLATIGTTSAVFAHDAAKPAGQILNMAKTIASRGARLLPDRYESELAKPVDLIMRSATSLKTFSKLPLSLMQRRKRRGGRSSVREAIQAVATLFGPFFDNGQVKIDLDELAPGDDTVAGSASELEAVAANLFTNAINAFNAATDNAPRRIKVQSTVTDGRIIVVVADTGPGINPDIDIDDIWLPGFTTFPTGSGLGLTIVRDIITDLRGRVGAVARGPLGGAEFTIELPLYG
jgi:signal transduction histidine kinase